MRGLSLIFSRVESQHAIDATSRSGRMVLVGEPKQYDTNRFGWFELLCVCPLAISLNPPVKTLLTSL